MLHPVRLLCWRQPGGELPLGNHPARRYDIDPHHVCAVILSQSLGHADEARFGTYVTGHVAGAEYCVNRAKVDYGATTIACHYRRRGLRRKKCWVEIDRQAVAPLAGSHIAGHVTHVVGGVVNQHAKLGTFVGVSYRLLQSICVGNIKAVECHPIT